MRNFTIDKNWYFKFDNGRVIDMRICSKHNVSLQCIGGESAHVNNWYCPLCDKESNKQNVGTTGYCDWSDGPEVEDGPWAKGWEERSIPNGARERIAFLEAQLEEARAAIKSAIHHLVSDPPPLDNVNACRVLNKALNKDKEHGDGN